MCSVSSVPAVAEEFEHTSLTLQGCPHSPGLQGEQHCAIRGLWWNIHSGEQQNPAREALLTAPHNPE